MLLVMIIVEHIDISKANDDDFHRDSKERVDSLESALFAKSTKLQLTLFILFDRIAIVVKSVLRPLSNITIITRRFLGKLLVPFVNVS